MTEYTTVALVLHAHLPYVRHPAQSRVPEEQHLFDAISDIYLPLLAVFERLEADKVPFRLALSFSPSLCEMLNDDLLRKRYLEHLDRLIELGAHETERTSDDPALNRLARLYYDKLVDDRLRYVERYDLDLIKAFDFFHKKGRLELLTTAATHAFLPFYSAYPEAIQAQMETALACHRSFFGKNPSGFWLPELGWFPGVDEYLRAYNFAYTIVDTHALVFGNPVPRAGTWAPVHTPNGLIVFARDLHASRQLEDVESGFSAQPLYRDRARDIGYDLPYDDLSCFLDPDTPRSPTGFKYWASSEPGKDKQAYDPDLAAILVEDHADAFMDQRAELGRRATELNGSPVLSVCAFGAELFGQLWYEGPAFLEALFRRGSQRRDIRFAAPGDCLELTGEPQEVVPQFSSWGSNGYAETWLDSSNDWTYRHLLRSVVRMSELAERFPDDGGLKERALNQAARELLLAQSSDWALIMNRRSSPDYARRRVEEGIMNFTSIYESLGGNYISTEWLTNLERSHKLFPTINYRIFRKKR